MYCGDVDYCFIPGRTDAPNHPRERAAINLHWSRDPTSKASYIYRGWNYRGFGGRLICHLQSWSVSRLHVLDQECGNSNYGALWWDRQLLGPRYRFPNASAIAPRNLGFYRVLVIRTRNHSIGSDSSIPIGLVGFGELPESVNPVTNTRRSK